MGKLARLALASALLCASAGAWAREALGVFGSWGAFRDDRPMRCFAIAEAVPAARKGDWRPYATVATWPRAGVRGQLHIRMRFARARGAQVTLAIGERRFALVAGGADAWAPDTPADAAIVAAMRSGSSMSISTVSPAGKPFADTYRLRGAATAIDAAALGCARRR